MHTATIPQWVTDWVESITDDPEDLYELYRDMADEWDDTGSREPTRSPDRADSEWMGQ